MKSSRASARSSPTAGRTRRSRSPPGWAIPPAAGKASGSWWTRAASTTRAGWTIAAGRTPKRCTPSNASAAATSDTWRSRSQSTTRRPTPAPGHSPCSSSSWRIPRSSRTCATTSGIRATPSPLRSAERARIRERSTPRSSGPLRPDTVMVGELAGGAERARARFFIQRQHRGVPLLIFADQPAVHLRLPIIEIGALERIVHYVKQESVLVDLEPLHIAVAQGALRVVFVAPEELSRNRRGSRRQQRQKIDAIGRIRRVGRGAGRGKQRGQPIHRDRHLSADRAGGDVARPAENRRDAQPPFQQFSLFSGEWPGVGEPLAAIVAGEDHDRVARDPRRIERIEHTA